MIRRTIVEKMLSLRWITSSLISRTLYSAAFKKFAEKTVIVSPLKLRGLENISLGKDVSIFEGRWLQAEAERELTMGDSVYVGHRCHIHAYDQVSIGSNTVIADQLCRTSERKPGSGIGNRSYLNRRIGLDRAECSDSWRCNYRR